MIAAAAFYLFAAILIVSATMVVSARNPVHAVLFLILAFFNASALFLLAGAEFLAMTLVIVYVGAVMVLFLFVVMMLDINFAKLREGFQRYAPVGGAVGVVLLIELGGVFGAWQTAPDAVSLRMAPVDIAVHNTAQLGMLIYTDYIFMFQSAGLILLVAMIGAIVLTLRDKDHNPNASRHQRVADQVARRKEDTLVMVDVPNGGKTMEFFRKLEPVVEEAAPSDGHGHDDHGHGGH